MKGRLLGIMEPTTERVRTRDFEVNPAPSAFVDGEYKWPFALLHRRAWVLPERPLLTHISERIFNMDSAQGIVPLNVAETARVEALNWTEAELLKPSVQAQHRIDPGRRHGQRNAPPPSTTRAGVMHMRSASAYTYALRIVGAPKLAFKIGWAFDYERRAKQFNHASLPDLGGLRYDQFFYHLWDTARQAFAMQQRLIRLLEANRHPQNNEVLTGISIMDFKNAWTNCVQKL